MSMHSKACFLRVLVGSLALFVGGAALSQQPPGTQGGMPVAPHQEPAVSITFKGGTLAEYAAALRAASDGANILVPEQATDVRVPAITLKDATVFSALEALGELVIDDYQVKVRAIMSPLAQPVYAVRVSRVRAVAGAPGQGMVDERARVVRVFSIKSLIQAHPGDPAEGLKAETILTAIETGLSFTGEAARAKAVVRYHADSGILFVHGTLEQVGVVEQVLASLGNDLLRARHLAPRPSETGPTQKEVRTR
jgi:hypothetical protein